MRWLLPLPLLLSAASAQAQPPGDAPTATYGVEGAVGMGIAGRGFSQDPPGEDDVAFGASILVRGFHPSGHGLGIRAATSSPVNLLGGGNEYGVHSVQTGYRLRFGARPGSESHLSATLGAGAALIWGELGFDSSCFISCPVPDDDPDRFDTLALGPSLSAAAAVHAGYFIAELAVTWQHGWALEPSSVGDLSTLLIEIRVGFSRGV